MEWDNRLVIISVQILLELGTLTTFAVYFQICESFIFD